MLISFESRCGTEIPDKIVQYGEKMDPPDNPVRDGYVFEGWYPDIDQNYFLRHLSDRVGNNSEKHDVESYDRHRAPLNH